MGCCTCIKFIELSQLYGHHLGRIPIYNVKVKEFWFLILHLMPINRCLSMVGRGWYNANTFIILE